MNHDYCSNQQCDLFLAKVTALQDFRKRTEIADAKAKLIISDPSFLHDELENAFYNLSSRIEVSTETELQALCEDMADDTSIDTDTIANTLYASLYEHIDMRHQKITVMRESLCAQSEFCSNLGRCRLAALTDLEEH